MNRIRTILGCAFVLLGFCEIQAGTAIIDSESEILRTAEIIASQDEFNQFDCYDPSDTLRNEQQTLVVPEEGMIVAFAFASLRFDCLSEIEGSLHRVSPEGILGESVSSVVIDPSIGCYEEPQWIVFELTEPFDVAAGETLAIRATARSILLSEDNELASGELLSDPSKDLTFRIYAIPEPSGSLLILLASIAVIPRRSRK